MLFSPGNDVQHLSDSSGFCSSESANIVNRAALFQKARNMASQAIFLSQGNLVISISISLFFKD